MTKHITENKLTDYFHKTVLNYSEKVAVVSSIENNEMTYGELDERSNQIANYFTARGIFAGSVIAVELQRSPESLSLILGIIKAGCAYAPIDANYPEQRKCHMMNVANAAVLITDTSSSNVDPNTLALDEILDNSKALSKEPSVGERAPESVAYVMFTSGSTGNPKAVQIQDKAICRLCSQNNELTIFSTDNVLLHSALVFDASTYEIWGAWLAGATLVVARNEPVSTRFFAEHIEAFDISVLWLTAPLLPWIAEQQIELVKGLRLLVAGGDALPPEAVNRIREYSPELTFVNGYGPTEATTFSCYYPIRSSQNLNDEKSSVPIGFALDGSHCLILNEALECVADGEIGELYIGGSGVGHGYLNDPIKTATQFIPDMFDHHGGRLYKTGDLVKRGEQGEIKFLGRQDQQIKVRGYRIELGEIDTALSNLTDVGQSTTLVVEKEASQKQIVSFVVADKNVVAAKIKDDLKTTLPEYMLPHQFIHVQALPLNVNGKVDRTKLLAMLDGQQTLASIEADETLESTLVDIFQEVLQLADVNTEQSFFDIGGDSISAIQISGLAEQRGIELTVSTIFEHKTINDITIALSKNINNADANDNEIKQLLSLWAEVLETPDISAEDSFFELGGDSIVAIQLAGIAEQHGLSCSVADIFNYKSVANIVASRQSNDEKPNPKNTPSSVYVSDKQLPEGIEAAYPASQIQVSMLIQSDVGRSSSTYHDILSHTIRLPFDENIFKAALKAVTDKHEILRTSFSVENEKTPLQLVHREVTPEYEVFGLQHLEKSKQKEQFEKILSDEKQRGFAWEQAGLVRAKVLILEPESFVLTLSFHHAIMDGWSSTVLIGDFVDLFAGNITQHQLQERVVTPYSQFIADEQSAINNTAVSEYWLNYLQDAQVSVLPSFPEEEKEQGVSQYSITISEQQTQQLKSIAAKLKVSLKHVMLALHMRTVSLLSGSSHALSGLVSHGRPALEGADRTVGLFINTVPFRSEVKVENWLSFIQRIFDDELTTLANKHYPLPNILRDSGASSLFDFAFNFTHFREYNKRFNGNVALVQRGAFETNDVFGGVDFEHSNFGLAVQAGLSANSRCAYLVLDADNKKYPSSAASLIVKAYESCLQHLLSSTEQNISEISLPDSTLVDLQATVTPPVYFDLMERFASINGEFPDVMAIVSGQDSVSYAELNLRAQSVANYLTSRKVQQGDIVAVHAERGIESIAALLGIWKAGACYLPIDPSYPDGRKAYMLVNSGCQLVLFDANNRCDEWCVSDASNVLIEDVVSTESSKAVCVDNAINPSSPAYLIYTSGSTGMPKGVMVPFSGVSNLISEQANRFNVTAATPCMQFASSSFDASLFEIIMSLFNGGTLHVIGEHMRLDPAVLSAYAMKHNVEVATLPASMLQTLSDYSWPSTCRMIIAGEAFPPDLARIWAEKAHVVNAYGPTESTVWATSHLCHEYESINVPIGKPIGGMQAYVLNELGHPLPAGVAGELYLGGPALALGYYGNSRLTAERFIPNPFTQDSGSRMYKTGDKARINLNGELEFLGRLDWQVKLRGFRIELGEIEQVIHSVEGVTNAAVVIKNDLVNGSKREWLACYCQLDEETTSEHVEAQICQQLPDYMIPGDFIQLAQFPLTINGKIDRKALEERVEQKEVTITVASSAEESVLLRVWQNVFGNDEIGIDDGFYSLGGDSILSIQLRAMTQKEGFDFELEDLFELQTIRKLVATLTRFGEEAEQQSSVIAPFSLIDNKTSQKLPSKCEDAYPLSRMQSGMLFHMQYNADSVSYHDVMYYLLKGTIQPEAFKKAMSLSVDQNPILRTAFDMSSYDVPLQLVYKHAELAFYHEDISALNEEQQREHLLQWEKAEINNPFALEKPGLVRVFIHQMSEQHYRLTLSCPHAILDGWSAATLVSQLLTSYKSIVAGQDPILEKPKLGYVDFIALEQESINNSDDRSYWADYVVDLEKSDIPHTVNASEELTTRRLNLDVSPEFSRLVDSLSSKLQVSTKSIFLSLHLKALSILSGQGNVTTGVINHGRPETEGSDEILGVFLNNLPFKMQVADHSKWHDLIEDVHRQEREHASHRRFPLSEIKALDDGQELFDVAFNYTAFRPYESMSDEWLGSGGHDYSNYLFVLQAGLSAVSGEYYLFLDADCTRLDEFYAQTYCQVYKEVIAHFLRESANESDSDLLIVPLPSEHAQKLSMWEGEIGEPNNDVWAAFEEQVAKQGERVAVR
ncbi:amino acid adenylation domain-containing protein, partial [Thalassotalea sp. 1_MG-2023]|uniref:non-ribosomal peptide synthetase n=1 Tax=Thalassotalea sp. 1_MG-2023 TaxID=3062680 RepID=UPI0026E1C0E5